MRGRRRAPSRLPTRYVVPAAVGVIVFGAATAFASTLAVTSTGLGSGNGGVSSCNTNAAVSFNTAYTATAPAGYKVTTTPLTTSGTGTGCANKPFKVTLTDGSNVALAERTGTLDGTGAFSPDFTSSSISAASVAGVSVVITG